VNRLITFGCSYTKGIGLKDEHSAWPWILAESLQKECVNLSEAGCSNIKIWWAILNTEFSRSDLVLVHWTYDNRSYTIGKDLDIGPWFNRVDEPGDLQYTVSKQYYDNLHSVYNSRIDSNLRITDAEDFLSRQGVRNYHMRVPRRDKDFDYGEDTLFQFKNHLTVNIWDKTKISETIMQRRGTDGKHPGEEHHKLFAMLIRNELREMGLAG